RSPSATWPARRRSSHWRAEPLRQEAPRRTRMAPSTMVSPWQVTRRSIRDHPPRRRGLPHLARGSRDETSPCLCPALGSRRSSSHATRKVPHNMARIRKRARLLEAPYQQVLFDARLDAVTEEPGGDIILAGRRLSLRGAPAPLMIAGRPVEVA